MRLTAIVIALNCWAASCPAAEAADQLRVLRHAQAEVGIRLQPVPRIVRFRAGAADAALVEDAELRFAGIRTWLMLPHETRVSAGAARRPLAAVEQDGLVITLASQPNSATGLALRTRVTLHPDQPWLCVRHGLANAGEAAHEVGIWAIVACQPGGTWIVPRVFDPGSPWSGFQFWPGSQPDSRPMVLSDAAITIASQAGRSVSDWKVGWRSTAGWVAYRTAAGCLVAWAQPALDERLPEGGHNLALYDGRHGPPEGRSELEHMGPLRQVPPGGTLHLDQYLALLPTTASAEDCAHAAVRILGWRNIRRDAGEN